jgi:hypothetical protein
MPSLFRKIADKIFGGVRQGMLERKQQAAAEKERRARAMADRAERAEDVGNREAQDAIRRIRAAKQQGNEAARKRAIADEQKALEFVKKQRIERESQERHERDAKHEQEQARLQIEKRTAHSREQLLKARKRIVDSRQAWPWAGPAPKAPKVYKSVNTGEGDLPDEQSFLLGQKYSAFASSNVVAIQFDPRHGGDLYIQYKKKGFYKYPRVGPAFALQMFHSLSKGIAVWDWIRVRGENPRLTSPPASTRKAFRRGVAPPSDLPLSQSAYLFAAGGGGL